jgi:hypothetical protein
MMWTEKTLPYLLENFQLERPSILLKKWQQHLVFIHINKGFNKKKLHGRKKEQVDLLSPTWFAGAQASYNKAKAELDQGAELSKILEHIAGEGICGRPRHKGYVPII